MIHQAEIIELFEIVIFAIELDEDTSIVDKPVKLLFKEIFNVSGDETVASKPVPVVTNIVLPEATPVY